MKTFFNVLYRRILYKIPLKFLLILLAICAIFIASFSSADNIIYNSSSILNAFSVANWSSTHNFTIPAKSTVCFFTTVNTITCAFWNNNSMWWWELACITNNNNASTTVNFACTNTDWNSYMYYSSTYNIADICPAKTSLECQTEYNLIPISSVDENYCTSNNLCPAQYTESQCKSVYGLIDESECTWWSWWWSWWLLTELYINNILHVWAPTILMNIPEEIDWDYAYTQWWNIMNIDVFGYNVDYEKMQSVIDTQSYIPTEDDFNNIIAILTPYTKIIVFFVFLFIVWAWIKKPFKSKKL